MEGCTLCLACVSACPTGALGDNPERPQLRFAEDACVQCGLCKATCPEKVITLRPQLDFRAATASARVLKEEEPFHCIRCNKPFGVKSTIERVAAKLEGKHWMFQNSAQRLDVIKMCEDCRVMAITEQEFDPYAAPPDPRRARPKITCASATSRSAPASPRPERHAMNQRAVLKRVRTSLLDIACEESGPTDGVAVLLMHGFPYDPRTYDEVVPPLVETGCRVIVPYLRGYGATRFLAADTLRSGQQAALGNDLKELIDALALERVVLAGYDWGGRAACIVAALWPERVLGLVSANGYNIQDIAG